MKVRKSRVITQVLDEAIDGLLVEYEKAGFELISMASWSLDTDTSYARFALYFRQVEACGMLCGCNLCEERK